MNDEFDFDGVILTLIVIVIGIILILGFITLLKKSFQPGLQKPKLDSSQMLYEQKQHMEDVQRSQDQMMRDLKRKIQDGKRY